jgi:hypothetical protein
MASRPAHRGGITPGLADVLASVPHGVSAVALLPPAVALKADARLASEQNLSGAAGP